MTGEVLEQSITTLDELLKSDEDLELELLRRHRVTLALRRAEELLRGTGTAEDLDLLEALRRAVPTVAHRVAWGPVRGAARRERRRSSTTLPAFSTLVQRVTVARGHVEQLVPALPLTLHGIAATVIEQLHAVEEQLGAAAE